MSHLGIKISLKGIYPVIVKSLEKDEKRKFKRASAIHTSSQGVSREAKGGLSSAGIKLPQGPNMGPDNHNFRTKEDTKWSKRMLIKGRSNSFFEIKYKCVKWLIINWPTMFKASLRN